MTRDHRPILTVAIGVVFLACLLAGQPSRAFAGDDEGFVRLFNGRNFDGWDVHAGDKSFWAVEEGLIVRRQGPYSPYYLRTTSATAGAGFAPGV